MVAKVLLFLLMTYSVSFAAVLPITEQMPSMRFLCLADIHFDPFLTCQNEKIRPCPLLVRLQQAPSEEWPTIFAQYKMTPSRSGQDTNYALLVSALKMVKQVAEKQSIQFVLVLGDFLGHDFPMYFKRYAQQKSASAYQSFAKKTLEFLNNEIAHTFPNTSVYILLGNNDTYQNDYFSEPGGIFLRDVGELFVDLLPHKNDRIAWRATFFKAGYYAIDLPMQVRLIMLNTVLFSYKAKGEVTQAAEQELAWLHQELIIAKHKQQKVLIAMHIPSGLEAYITPRLHLFTLMKLWQTKYIDKFKAELQQFSPEIIGIFVGHLHSDWTQILTFDNGVEVPILATPSISPIFGNQPGFKMYTYRLPSLQFFESTTFH